MKCNNCQKEIINESKFCPYCGETTNKINNNYCTNCGNKLEVNSRYCTKCGVEIKNIQEETKPQKDNSNTYIIVFIISTISPFVLAPIINFLTSLGIYLPLKLIINICPLVSIVTIVTAKIKYPQNKVINILFWLFIILIILLIIVSILLMWTCLEAMSSCPG